MAAPWAGVTMLQIELETSGTEHQREDARLSVLHSFGILDTAPETNYDTITRLAAEYFCADAALLGFIDTTRVWIKAHWGEAVRELPRGLAAREAASDDVNGC